jgi:hypothetical protein
LVGRQPDGGPSLEGDDNVVSNVAGQKASSLFSIRGCGKKTGGWGLISWAASFVCGFSTDASFFPHVGILILHHSLR